MNHVLSKIGATIGFAFLLWLRGKAAKYIYSRERHDYIQRLFHDKHG